KSFRPIHRHKGGWCIGAPEQWPLYGLADLPATPGRVYVVEGEKCRDILAKLGLPVVASAGGASSANKTDWSPLAGYDVVILPDNDKAGQGYADDVTRELLA